MRVNRGSTSAMSPGRKGVKGYAYARNNLMVYWQVVLGQADDGEITLSWPLAKIRNQMTALPMAPSTE